MAASTFLSYRYELSVTTRRSRLWEKALPKEEYLLHGVTITVSRELGVDSITPDSTPLHSHRSA